jgi:(2R)-sulfolactate sulfo-lyase subunit alpha
MFRSATRSRCADIKSGDTAIKYGEDIGKFVADVEKGGHVHTHNLKTKRW